MLGLPGMTTPVFMRNTAAGWLPFSVWIERTNAMSSTHVAMWGNRLETSRPHWPYFWKVYGLRRMRRGLANRFAWSVFFSLLQSITVLSNFSSAGFGSKESIWLTPPQHGEEDARLRFRLM